MMHGAHGGGAQFTKAVYDDLVRDPGRPPPSIPRAGTLNEWKGVGVGVGQKLNDREILTSAYLA